MLVRSLRTEAGVFNVTINDDIHIDSETRKETKIGKLISVGGKNTCVFINTFNDLSEGKLTNVITSKQGCENEGKRISGLDTVLMVNLAFTVVKEVSPHVKTLILEDTSQFPCDMENGRINGISTALYELAFHQATWYERHFGAKISIASEHEKYLKSKCGFTKKKPEVFIFGSILDKKLSPLYEKTNTWEEFFSELYKIDKKCKFMVPWYKIAVSDAINNFVIEKAKWVIDLYNSKVKDIKYQEIKVGGTKKLKNLTKIKRHRRKNSKTKKNVYVNRLF